MLLVRRVSGYSMLPGLGPGRLVIAVQKGRAIRKGDVVILSHRGLEKIKRVRGIANERIYVVGDNPVSSTDSRSFGWLPLGVVAGRVIWPLGL